MRTSNGFTSITPRTLQVGREDEFFVTVAKRGFEPTQILVRPKLGATGGAAMAGNVLVSGIIGLGVDASTGAG